MIDLRPCTECRRHVDSSASECPFCTARLEPTPPPVMLPRGRFTRAAVFAGATLLGAAAGAACGGSEETDTETEVSTETETETTGGDTGGGDTGGDATDTGDGEHADHATPMPYGAPPVRDRRV